MTPDTLARIAAAIDADAATEAANWPLSRERTRAYLALARAVAGLATRTMRNPGDSWWIVRGSAYTRCIGCGMALAYGDPGVWQHTSDCPAMRLDAALAALAPVQEAPDA